MWQFTFDRSPRQQLGNQQSLGTTEDCSCYCGERNISTDNNFHLERIFTAARLLFEGPDVVMLSWNIFIIFNKTSAGLLARQARSGYPSRFSLYFNGKSTDYSVSNGFSSLSRLLLYQNEIIFGWNLFCEKSLLTSWVSYFQTSLSGRSGPSTCRLVIYR